MARHPLGLLPIVSAALCSLALNVRDTPGVAYIQRK
jgi:hypothetical protein